ncbi:MAG: NAD(P)H-dependent oxidoreductase subunit E [Pseudomonadota bacterium]
MDFSKTDKIIEEHDNDQGHLIGILQDIQAEHRYLPEPQLKRVAEKLKVPVSRVFSVATFFKAFSLEERGEKQIQVCMGTACHVRGAKRVLEELERDFGIKAGETSKDMRFTLETVNCVGACALGPVVVVNGEYHGKVDGDSANKLAKELHKCTECKCKNEL